MFANLLSLVGNPTRKRSEAATAYTGERCAQFTSQTMIEIQADRDVIKTDLLAYGEFELAAKIDGLTDDQLKEIGRIAANQISKGGYLAKTITYGVIEFFEGEVREPKRKKRDMSFYTTKPVDDEKTKQQNFTTKLFSKLKN